MDSLAKILRFAQHNKHVQESLDLIEQSILRYGLEKTCISFNGGKDCTAVLHLVHSVTKKLNTNNNETKLAAFYAQLPDHFKEESDFVCQMAKVYNLELIQYSNLQLKDSLFQLKLEHPSIEAIFIGTRSDDFRPGTRMLPLSPTDDGWPKFMRVNPILDWSYNQVWDFIRQLNVPYCDLYNQGYSSIGTKSNTFKNSSLLRYDENNRPYYLPAWDLIKSSEERLSRSSSLDVAK